MTILAHDVRHLSNILYNMYTICLSFVVHMYVNDIYSSHNYIQMVYIHTKITLLNSQVDVITNSEQFAKAKNSLSHIRMSVACTKVYSMNTEISTHSQRCTSIVCTKVMQQTREALHCSEPVATSRHSITMATSEESEKRDQGRVIDKEDRWKLLIKEKLGLHKHTKLTL